MGDMNKMLNVICDEIDKIAEKGLTTSNLESAYKLVDMYKDLKTVDAMEEAGYSEAMSYDGDSMAMRGKNGRYSRDDGMSNRQHYVRGHYSREGGNSYGDYASERYSQAKMDYRNSRAGKQDVMGALNDKMKMLRDEFKEMSKDSDFAEERQKIDKCVDVHDRMLM